MERMVQRSCALDPTRYKCLKDAFKAVSVGRCSLANNMRTVNDGDASDHGQVQRRSATFWKKSYRGQKSATSPMPRVPNSPEFDPRRNLPHAHLVGRVGVQ